MGYSRKKLDLTGQRFEKLTVLAPAENVDGRTAWRCRCDCGGESVVKTAHLRGGHVSSCGCIPKATYVDGTCVEMIRASTKRCNNTSGVPGVDWMAKKQLWRATICFKGTRRYLGGYRRFEEAVQARKQAEEEFYGTFLREYEQSRTANQ